MREAVRKRIQGLTERKRRGYYNHAAFLAAACVAIDESGATTEWLAAIRKEYRRFPALQRELDQYLRQSRKKRRSS
jgi:disulfide oxidoreductase YuzD